MPVDTTQGFFHRYAGDFDAIYSTGGGVLNSVVNRLFRRSMKLRFVKSLEGCQPIEGRTVLDVGCGPGHYSISLAQRGAARVVGLDFAEGMLELARERALGAGVGDRCTFQSGDFLAYGAADPFDYVVVMGFMDYMADPKSVVAKVLSLTRSRALFSFPAAGGILGWQRRIRYRNRCSLYLYKRKQLERLFAQFDGVTVRIEQISRDFFVTAAVKSV
jgi:SAM-dependent methyltransferase